MIDVTFGSSQINWGASIKSLSSSSFTSVLHGSALSSDKSKIYVILPFGKASGTNSNTNYTYTLDLNLYFITLSTTTGSVAGTIYMTNSGAYYVNKAILIGDYVVASFGIYLSVNSTFLMFFNTATSSFSFKLVNVGLSFSVYHPIANK